MAFLEKKDFAGFVDSGLVKVKDNNITANLGGTAVGFDDDGLAAVWDAYRISHAVTSNYGIVGTGTLSVKIGGVKVVDGKSYMLVSCSYGLSNSGAPTLSANCIEVEDGAGDADNAITVSLAISKNHKPVIFADVATKAASPAHSRVWLQSAQYNITCDNWTDAITDAANPLASGICSSGVRNVRMESALTFLGDGTANGDSIDFGGGDYTIGANCVLSGAFGVSNPMEAHPTFSGTITRYFTAEDK